MKTSTNNTARTVTLMEQVRDEASRFTLRLKKYGSTTTSTVGIVTKLSEAIIAPPAPVVSYVVVKLGDPTLLVGEGTIASAEARDATGNLIPGKAVSSWSVDDASVASVTQSGEIRALANGITHVNAVIDGVKGIGDLDVSPLPLPNQPPVPEPPPAGTITLAQLMGAIPTSAAAVEAMGGSVATYMRLWREYMQKRRAADGSAWDKSDYYCRASSARVLGKLTGDATITQYANEIAVSYRDGYWAAQAAPYQFNGSSYWSMPMGVAMHYLATGDAKSRDAVGWAAGWLTSGFAYERLGSNGGGMENRWRARILEIAVLSHVIGAPCNTGPWVGMVVPPPGTTWAEKAKNIIDRIRGAQTADGSIKNPVSCGHVVPFMNLLLAEAMILYYRLIAPEPWIVEFVRKMLEYDWQKMWLSPSQGFSYIEGVCAWEGGTESPGATPDLTMMFPAAYAWLGKQIGGAVGAEWLRRAQIIFDAGVPTGYLDGAKQFNQFTVYSYRYPELKKV